MKDFTAIQNTTTIKGMAYSFKAENLAEAIKKAPKLLSGEIIEVFEIDDLGNKIKPELSLENFNNGVVFTFSNGKEEMEIINFLVENGLDCNVIKTPNSFRKRDYKTKKEIFIELSERPMSTVNSIDHSAVSLVFEFYEKYPEYRKLNASGALIIANRIKANNYPEVYSFPNGDLVFVGKTGDFFAPLAVMGKGMTLNTDLDWSNLEETSNGLLKKIEFSNEN